MTGRTTLILFIIVGLGSMALALPPGRWWQQPKLQEELDLSPEQVDRIDRLHRDGREQLIDLRADLEKKRLRFQDAMEKDPFDAEGARRAQASVLEAETALQRAAGEIDITIRSILTRAQYRRLSAHDRSGPARAPRPPMAPGHPHPPQPPGPGPAPSAPEPPDALPAPPAPPAR